MCGEGGRGDFVTYSHEGRGGGIFLNALFLLFFWGGGRKLAEQYLWIVNGTTSYQANRLM